MSEKKMVGVTVHPHDLNRFAPLACLVDCDCLLNSYRWVRSPHGALLKIRNLFLALKDQLPLRRMYRNFFVTRNAWGLFHENSHIAQRTGKPKVQYGSRQSAEKASYSMQKKHGGVYRVYKCVFCDGYHVGRNRIV